MIGIAILLTIICCLIVVIVRYIRKVHEKETILKKEIGEVKMAGKSRENEMATRI